MAAGRVREPITDWQTQVLADIRRQLREDKEAAAMRVPMRKAA